MKLCCQLLKPFSKLSNKGRVDDVIVMLFAIVPLAGSMRPVCVAALPRFMNMADSRMMLTVSVAKIWFFICLFLHKAVSARLLAIQKTNLDIQYS
jgi:hypothetical protein